MLTFEQLSAAAPAGDPKIIKAIADAAPSVFPKYAISTRNRALGFLSTALEESGFRTLSENLNYSAERLCQVWPSRFPTLASAEPFARNPQALANRVYGGRMGNIGPNDGWLYRGRGLIQITGRDNYAALETKTGLPLIAQPDLAADLAHLLECSVALFVDYPAILAHCDRGEWTAVWALVGSGRANGPVVNLANHQIALASLQKALPAAFPAPSPPPAAPPVLAPPAPAPEPGFWARLLALFGWRAA